MNSYYNAWVCLLYGSEIMQKKYREIVHKTNCLSNDMNALYHQAARKLGVADSVLIVSYTLFEKGDGCALYDVYTESGVSKQTINSAIRKLETDGVLYLEQDKGKAKRIRLTESGKRFVERTAGTLFAAECRAFGDWTDEEFDIYLRLMARYNSAFRAEIEKWDGGKNEKTNPII